MVCHNPKKKGSKSPYINQSTRVFSMAQMLFRSKMGTFAKAAFIAWPSFSWAALDTH
jgi:hypothetical protein